MIKAPPSQRKWFQKCSDMTKAAASPQSTESGVKKCFETSRCCSFWCRSGVQSDQFLLTQSIVDTPVITPSTKVIKTELDVFFF